MNSYAFENFVGSQFTAFLDTFLQQQLTLVFSGHAATNSLAFEARGAKTWCIHGETMVCQHGESAHQLGVSKNRGTPKWMVYNGKPYYDLGVPLFSETSN